MSWATKKQKHNGSVALYVALSGDEDLWRAAFLAGFLPETFVVAKFNALSILLASPNFRSIAPSLLP